MIQRHRFLFGFKRGAKRPPLVYRATGRTRTFSFMLLGFLLSWGPHRAAGETPPASTAADNPGLELSLLLLAEGQTAAAAIELRRLARAAHLEEEQAAYYWGAAHLYVLNNDWRLADRMLDHAEDAWWGIESPALTLRGEVAYQQRHHAEADFFWNSLLRGELEPAQEKWLRRRLAAVHLQEGNVSPARELLEQSPRHEHTALDAVDRYARGRDKRPFVGGLLGMLPGMGYVYAGEYANAFRSLLLNAIFIYGMVDTAQNGHWGGFAVISFFELTWYTGSIYGGIDASHRYNERRLHTALQGITGDSTMEPDWSALPAVSVHYHF